MSTTSVRTMARTLGAILSIAIGLWTFQARSQGNLANNGGFEGGYNNGPIGWGWTYNYALWMGMPDAAEGRDYAGIYGTLYQDLNTTPGQAYHLRFAMAGNFNLGQIAELEVHWDSLTIGTVTWDPIGHSVNNPGWVWGDFDVTAIAPATRLTFLNPYVGTQDIPLLDAVQVVAVPEPSALCLVSLGVLGLLISCPSIRRQREACTGRGGRARFTIRRSLAPCQ